MVMRDGDLRSGTGIVVMLRAGDFWRRGDALSAGPALACLDLGPRPKPESCDRFEPCLVVKI